MCALTLQNFQVAGVCGTPCEGVAATCSYRMVYEAPVDPLDYGLCISDVGAATEAECAESFPYTGDCSGDGTGGECGATLPLGSGGPGCSALAACCPSLPGGNVSACDEVAAEGYESTCVTYLGWAKFDGLCGAD